MGEKIKGFGAGEKTAHRDLYGEMGFADKRSAGWWIMREMLDPSNGISVALPPDDPERGLELTGDLATPTYRDLSSGKTKVEEKAKIRKKIKRSTDCADAVMHILARKLVSPKSPYLGFIEF